MITDEKLLRQYLEAPPIPFETGDVIGVSTYLTGRGEGVFYRLRSGQVMDARGRSIEARPFGDTAKIIAKDASNGEGFTQP